MGSPHPTGGLARRLKTELERTIASWRQFLEGEPWRHIDGDDIFRIDDEASGEHYYASILGHQKIERGLVILRGEEGLQVLGSVVEQEVDHDQAMTLATSICITRHDGPIPEWYRDFLRLHLGKGRRSPGFPMLYANEKARSVRAPNAEELRLLADAMEAVVDLAATGELRPPRFEPGRAMPCVRLARDGRTEVTRVVPEFRRPSIEAYRLPEEVQDDLAELPIRGGTDLVSCSIAPATVQDRKVRLLIVADPESDVILSMLCTELHDLAALARCLFDVWKGRNAASRVGRPMEIQTDSRYFYEAFKDALFEIGVLVTCFERIPQLEHMREGFASYLRRGELPG